MFIIRMKQTPGWVVMKTTVGPLMVAFATESLAEAYLKAMPAANDFVAVSREVLLQSEPDTLDGVQQVLLFPSADVLRSFFRDGQTFPYQDYVIELSPAGPSSSYPSHEQQEH